MHPRSLRLPSEGYLYPDDSKQPRAPPCQGESLSTSLLCLFDINPFLPTLYQQHTTLGIPMAALPADADYRLSTA